MSNEDDFNVQIKNDGAFSHFSNEPEHKSEIIEAAPTTSMDFDAVMCCWTCIFKLLQVTFYFAFKYVLNA